ncbi:aldehyde dehydrogenase family protein [Egicoccus sp. AB-alg2]|uniref:aldehyde dehydrogenase family protein n=1 Tax=Egicoccus sp. AB-alg2 TaxID=3242693 RepID=UPI00359DD5FB
MTTKLYLDGAWTDAGAGGTRDVISPHDQRVIATVAEGDADDATTAVLAARRAFDTGPWRTTTAKARGEVVRAIGDLVVEHLDEFARRETLDTGKPLADSVTDMHDIASVFHYYAGVADAHGGRVVDAPSPDVVSRVQREPVGVCTQISPWNYPLLQASWKLAPALAAGNTVVVKPSEQTPLTTLYLVELIDEHLDLPPGVVNLVLGAGAAVGQPLTSHPAVDLVSFTGGVATGRRIMAEAAATVKKIALELGGKNPNIVFADVDLDVAADHALTAVFLHAGQVCSAGARLLVQDEVHDALVQRIVDRLPEITLGDGFVDGVRSGPLISAEHRDKVESYVAIGLEEGANLAAGGSRPDDPALADGFYYLPTVFTDCTSKMRIVQEEVFGPVLTVERFRDEEQAVALANDTIYGLAAAVWTDDVSRAQRVANALRCGTVWINDFHPYFPQAEWGGYKQSGFGRELGVAGFEEYTETKHVYQNLRPGSAGWL